MLVTNVNTLWSTKQNSFVTIRAVEPEPKQNVDGCSRSQKLLEAGAGAWNLGSGSAEVVCWAGELYK